MGVIGSTCARSPCFDILLERWVEAGRNVGFMVAKASHLLDLYGVDILGAAAREAIARGTHDPGALAVLCEDPRATDGLVPIDIDLGAHVPDRDVIPHDLETYDAHLDDIAEMRLLFWASCVTRQALLGRDHRPRHQPARSCRRCRPSRSLARPRPVSERDHRNLAASHQGSPHSAPSSPSTALTGTTPSHPARDRR